MIVPAIIVKDKAFHQEWATVMKVIRLVVNIFIIIVSIATLFAPGSLSGLMKVITWTDLALATADTAIQILKDEIGNTTWGKDFLEAWDMIYLGVGFATALPALGAILRNGAKLLTYALSADARIQLMAMLLFAVRLSDDLPRFAEGAVQVITNYALALGRTIVSKMTILATEGVYLLKGVREGGSGATEFFLCYKDVVLHLGTRSDIIKSIRDIVSKGKNGLGKYLDRQYVAKTGTGGGFRYLTEATSTKMVGQELEMSCSAACIRQLAKENGKTISEKAARIAGNFNEIDEIKTQNIGPALQKVLPDNTVAFGVPSIPGQSWKQVAEYLSDVYKKPWIAVLKPSGAPNGHAVIVDKIVDGVVYIRDPWDPVVGHGAQFGVEATMK
jgi:hypothetical protein